MPVNITVKLLQAIEEPYKSNLKRKAAQAAYNVALPSLMNTWFPVYGITTKLRVAHFLAQACVETANFLTMTEVPKHGGQEYEPGTHAGALLGNRSPGDGPKFIGRGLLNLTGRGNYITYGTKIHQDLVDNPGIVASNLALAVRTSCAYWQSLNLNSYADMDDFDAITYRVNGGYTGRVQRMQALIRAKRALHI